MIPENCVQCGRCQRAASPFMPASGALLRCDVLFVGESPGTHEDAMGTQFIGKAGKILRTSLTACGFTNVRMAFVNAVRCATGTPTPTEVALCRPFVLDDITRIKPKLVVLLGAVALKSALNQANITRRRGELQVIDGVRYLPVFHPMAIGRNPRLSKSFTADLLYARQILESLASGVPKYEQLRSRYTMPTTKAEALAMLAQYRTYKVLACDTEFYPLNWRHTDFVLLGISFAETIKTGGFVPLDHPECLWRGDPEVHAAAAEVVTTVPLILHHAAIDVPVLSRGLAVPMTQIRVVFDTMVSSMALHGDGASHALKTLAHLDADTGGYEEEVNAWLTQQGMQKKKRSPHPPSEEAAPEDIPVTVEVDFRKISLPMLGVPYAAGDADTTAQITRRHHPQIKATQQQTFYYEIALPSYYLNVLMHQHGLLLDPAHLEWRRAALQEAKVRVYDAAREDSRVAEYALAIQALGKEFSLRSTAQMQALLFTVMGLTPSSRMTPRGQPALDAKALHEMRLLNPTEPLLDLLLEASKINTYLGTFIEGWTAACEADGRVHPTHHNFTASFRRGTTRPNVQNLPYGNQQPTDLWNMRMIVQAPPGKALVFWDYAALEYRLAACYSGDPNMLAGCGPGGDPHQVVVEKLFGGDHTRRKLAKTVNYLFLYGGSPARLRHEIAEKTGEYLSLDETVQILSGMQQLYTRLAEHIETVHRVVALQKYVTTPLGQIRWLPHIESTDKEVRERAKREAWNHQNQSVGHGCLQKAMHEFQRQEIDAHPERDWKILVDTHDGFGAEIPDEDVREAAALGVHYMQTCPRQLLGDWLKVDLPVEVSTGTHWGDLRVLKDLESL